MNPVEATGELFRSGAPIWSFTSYRIAFAVASGAAIAGWLVAALAWWQRARSRARRASWGVDLAGLVAIAIVVAWVLAAVAGSRPPADGRFCFTPSTWTGGAAPSCVAEWPVQLMAATLAWPLVALATALAARSAAAADRRRVVLYGAIALAAVVTASGLGPIGLVTPDMFSDGGIAASRAAAIELTASVEVGVATLVAGAVFAAAALAGATGRVASRPGR